jgi:hypothetical protein
VFFIVCVVLCAVFRLIAVLFCVMCVICVLCLIVNHCHRVKTHLQLINITLHIPFFSPQLPCLLKYKGKVVPALLVNYAPHHEDALGSGGIVPPSMTSVLDGGE